MRIRCIENNGLTYITLGNVYPVISGGKLSNEYISIIADNGSEMQYLSSRFEEVGAVEAPVDLLALTKKFLGR